MVRITVLYANEAGKKFDNDYDVNKHMKLVHDRLGALGLVRTDDVPKYTDIQPQVQISEIIG